VQNVQDVEAGVDQPTGPAPVATPETATEPVADFDSRTPEERARQQNKFRAAFNREEPPARQRFASLQKPPTDGRTAPTVVGPAQRAVAAAVDRTGADLPRPPAAPVPEHLDPVQPTPAIGMTVAEMRAATRNQAALQKEAGRKLRESIQPVSQPQTPVVDRSLRTIQPDTDPSIAAESGLRVATGEGGGLFASHPELIRQAEAAEQIQEVPQGEGFEPIRNLFRGLAAGGLGLGESTGTILRYLGGEGEIDAVAALGERIEGFFQPRMRAFAERAAQTFRADQNILENPELLLDPDFLTFTIGQIVPSLLATITPVGVGRAAVRKLALNSLAKKTGAAVGAVGAAAEEGRRVALTAKQLTGLGKAAGKSDSAGKFSQFVKIGDRTLDLSDPVVMAKLTRIGKAANAVGLGIGGVAGGALEGSSTYRETFDTLVEQGVPEDVARETAENAFLMMTAGSGVLNSIGLRGLMKLFDKQVSGVKARALIGLQEAVTEYLEGPLEAGIQLGQETITVEQAIQKMKDETNVLPAAFITGFFMPGAGGQLGMASDRTLPPAQEAAASTQEGEPGELPPVDPGAGPAGQAVNVIPEEASGTAQAEAEEVDETTVQEPDEGEAATAAGKPSAAEKRKAGSTGKDTGTKPAPARPDDEVVTEDDLVTEPEIGPEDEGDVEPEPTREELAFDEQLDEPTADDLLNARAALSTDEDGEFEISKQTVAQLKAMADEFGVKKTGNKAAIITRITDAAADLVAGRDTQEAADAQAIPETEDQVQQGRAVTEGGGREGGEDIQQPVGRAERGKEADRKGREPRAAKTKSKVKPKAAAKKPAAKTTGKKTEKVKPKTEKLRGQKIAKTAAQRQILDGRELDKAHQDPARTLTEDDINLDVLTKDDLTEVLTKRGLPVRGNKTQQRQRILDSQVVPTPKGVTEAPKPKKGKPRKVKPNEVVTTQEAVEANSKAVIGEQESIDFAEQSGVPAPVSDEEIDRQAKEIRQRVTDETPPDQGTLFDASGKRVTGVGAARGTTKGGKVIGAPDHVTTMRQAARQEDQFVANLDAENAQTLLNNEGTVKEIAKTGTKGPSQENLSSLFWYERAAGEVMRVARGSRERADQLFRLLSLYSQANSVASNTTAAINSLNEFLDGNESPAFGRFPEKTRHVIKDLLEAESMAVFIRNNEGELSEISIVEGGLRNVGPKMISFYGNLHDAGFGEDTFAQDSTIDRWMMRMFGYNAESPSAAQYAFAKQMMINITDKFNAANGTNLKPRQIQAAMWTQAKNDSSEIALENRREAQGILKRSSVNALLKQKRMTREFIHRMVDTFSRNLGGEKVTTRMKQQPNKVILQTLKDKVSTLDFTKEFEPEVETFQESIQNATQLVTAEVTPSADTAVGSTLTDSSPETQQKLLNDSLAVITNKETGRDELADQVGISLGFTETQQGGFEGNVSPVVVTGVLPQGGTTAGFNRDAVNLYSRAWQYLFRQKAVPWMRPVIKGTAKKADGIGRYFRFNRDLTELEIEDFMATMGFRVHTSLGFTKVGEGEYLVVNFRTPDGKPAIADPNTGIPLKDSVFSKGMQELRLDVRDRLGDGLDEFSEFRSEGEYHGDHNWQEDPEGKSIADDIVARGSPDLLKWLDGRRKVLDGINNSAARAVGQDEAFFSAEGFRDRQEETPRSERRPIRAPVPIPRLVDTFGGAVEEIIGRFGTFTGKNTQEQLKIYPLQDLAADPQRVLDQAAQHGFLVKFFSFEENAEAGVEFKLPRLTRDGYKQGTVWIYNPGNMAGSFKDKDYTLAWRVTHETAHGITEQLMQEKYGDSKRYGRMGRTTKGIRGVAGKQVEVTLKPLTLLHAQRAVEWEDVTFRTQRLLLEELGVTITDEQFNMENRINMSDAMYRSLTGEFGESGEAGFLPDSTPVDVKDVLIALEETENRLADFQSRDENIGIELNTWQQVPDAKLKQLINRAKSNGKPNPTAQAAATGQPTAGAILTEADLRPSGKPPQESTSDRTASAAEGAAQQLSDPTADDALFSADDRLSTVTNPKDRGKKPKTPLTADQVRFHLLEIINSISSLINVRIVQSHSDLPDAIQLRMKRDQIHTVRGVYMPSSNTLYIVADSAVNLAGAERTILHEAFGHFAMSSMPQFDAIKARLQKIIDSNTDPVINRLVKGVKAKGHVSGDQFLDEVIAEMSETMTSRNAAMKEVIALVKEMIRALGFNVEMSNTDMMALLRASRRRIERRALAAAGFGIDRTSEKYVDFLKSDNLKKLRKASTDQEVGIALEQLADEFDVILFSASAPMTTELDEEWSKKMNTPFRELSWTDRLKKSMQVFHDLSFDDITQGLIDSANAQKVDEIRLYGQVLDSTVSSYKAMSTIRNMNNVMGAVMRHGIPALTENFINLADGTRVKGLNFTNPENGQAFQEIFTPLQKIGGESQLRNWEKWMVANRAGRLIKEDAQAGRIGKSRREKLIEQELVDKTLQWARDHKADNGQTYEEIFNEVNDAWQAVNKANLDLAEQTGVIDKEERLIWDSYDYIPFWREMGALESGRPAGRSSRNDVSSAGLFRLTGSVDRDGSPTKLEGNVVDSMFMNTAYLLERSYRNEAHRRTKDVGLQTGSYVKEPQVARPQRIPNIKAEDLIKMLFNSGLINAATEEDAVAVYDSWSKAEKDKWLTFFNRVKPPGDDIVTVMEKGKPVYYRVTDPLLLRSIVGMQGKNIGMWMSAMRTSKKWLTIGVTTDPAFMLANWMRDTVQTFIVSKAPLHSLADPIRSIGEAFNDSPAMLALAYAGRGGGGFYDTNPERIRDLLKEMGVPGEEVAGFMKTVMSPKKLVHFWKRVGTASEFANRVRIYDSLKLVWDRRIAELEQQGIKGQAAIDQAVSEGLATPEEAAFQAQDLLNFTRSGDYVAIQNLIQIVPFLNARIQGLNRLWRGAKESPLSFATKGSALMAISLAIAIANDDDDRYNELPEWDRDTYYHFWINGEHIRLPKPFESGVLFSTIPERIWRAGKGIDGWDEFSRSMLHAGLDTFAFNPLPQLFKPAIESYFNTNIFTSTPIIPAGMENLLPQRQYDWRTGEFSRWVGDAMPDSAPDIMQSPKRIEHLMRGYFGALGVYSMSVANVMTDSILHGPERALGEIGAMRLHELPVVKRFKQGDVPHTTKYNRILWEMVREADAVSRTIKKYQEEGEGQKALGLARDEQQLIALRPRLRKIATQVSAVNKQINQIALDRRLSPERRAILRDKLLKQRNALTKQVEPFLDYL
jgi:hypothetical protein